MVAFEEEEEKEEDDDDDDLRRVVSVVALRLESRQGLILVHVADVSPAG